MPESPKLDVNSWLEDELYQQYKHDRQAVDASWKQGGLAVCNGDRDAGCCVLDVSMAQVTV